MIRVYEGDTWEETMRGVRRDRWRRLLKLLIPLIVLAGGYLVALHFAHGNHSDAVAYLVIGIFALLLAGFLILAIVSAWAWVWHG